MKAYRLTVAACYVGYITQAIVNTLAPLLFVLFQRQYGISTVMLSGLILLNFGVQLLVDALSVRWIDRYGYRRMIVAAHIAAALGLTALGLLPLLLPQPFIGMVIAVLLYAFGGGLIEVAVSPVIHALPGEQKEMSMSLLHSFYCWGQMLVVLISTLLLLWTGDKGWYGIPLLWALIPCVNAVLFCKVPLADMVTGEESCGGRQLFRGAFFLFMLLMLAAGASELTVSQWASFFAEQGLGISKTLGDLCGPCLFALMMGIGRLLYGLFGSRLDVRPALLGSAVLCAVSYLLIALSPFAWLSLAGCALCGFSVSLMWPGTISYAAGRFPTGGALLFGVLALCGDAGCSLGPWLAGTVAAVFEGSAPVTGLKAGMLTGTLFPLLLIAGVVCLIKKDRVLPDGGSCGVKEKEAETD